MATRKYKNTYVIHIYKRNQSDSLKVGRGFIAIIAIYVCVCLGLSSPGIISKRGGFRAPDGDSAGS